MKKILILAALAALLTACGGGDPEPRVSIYETPAGGPFLGSSGKTHVNELEPVTVTASSTATITITGDFVAPAGQAGLIYSRLSPAWNVNGTGWTIGAGAPALQEIRLETPGSAEYRTAVRATYAVDLPAGSTLAAGIYFVDHATAQVPGSLVNARTRVEVTERR